MWLRCVPLGVTSGTVDHTIWTNKMGALGVFSLFFFFFDIFSLFGCLACDVLPARPCSKVWAEMDVLVKSKRTEIQGRNHPMGIPYRIATKCIDTPHHAIVSLTHCHRHSSILSWNSNNFVITARIVLIISTDVQKKLLILLFNGSSRPAAIIEI